MFFFIAGIQPKTRIVDAISRRCPQCGLFQARLQQVDHYLSLFFIPLVPIKRGEPFLYCRHCHLPVSEEPSASRGDTVHQRQTCGQCGRIVQPGFKFCPHCGTPLGG